MSTHDDPIEADVAQLNSRYANLAEELERIVEGPVFVRSEGGARLEKGSGPQSLPERREDNQNGIAEGNGGQNVDEDDYGVDGDGFETSTRVFNAAATLNAKMVVRPRHTKDVVTTIKFCQQYHLSPSIKSGGFSTAGWSIQGDVVLDMQLMDSIEMMAPQAFHSRSATMNQHSVDENEKVQESVPLADKGNLKNKRAKITLSREDAARGITAKMQNAGIIDRLSQKEEYEAGDATLTKDEMRERKTMKKGEDMVRDTEDNMPRTESGDSGAVADSEGSSNQSRSQGGSSDGSSGDKRGKQDDQEMASISSLPQVKDGTSRTTNWVDQNMDLTSGSQSESASSTSQISTSNGNTSAPTSGEPDSEDKEELSSEEGTASPLPPAWNPTSSFEHERWQRHHCPPGSTGNRVQLPATGGFFWSSDNGGVVNQNTTLDSDASFDALEPMHSIGGGSTIKDLYANNGLASGSSTGGYINLDQQSSNQNVTSPGLLNYDEWSPSDIKEDLKPGIHKDKYQLVEVGPGVGIRGIDTFTDRAGHLSDYERKQGEEEINGKGKGQENVEKIKVDERGIDFVASGVPYHVPLSAYPVGSTAMTIGGFGYLSRAYGLSLDNLVEVEMVLADGRVVILNEDSKMKSKEEAELWWAVRGAAPCFGVVTRLVAKAYPVPRVYSGNLIYSFNPVTAPSLLRHWRDCLKGTGDSIPRELYSNLILTAGPPSGVKQNREHVIVIQICFLGTSAADDVGNSFVQAISSWTGERVLLKDMADKSFLDQQDGVAQVLKSGTGRRWMVRGDLINTLTDDVIYKTVKSFHAMGSNRAVWFFELIGGAIEDEKETCVGEEQRKAKFTVAALQQWMDEEDDEKCVGGVETWVRNVLSDVSVGGPFACFLERQEPEERCQGSFGKENFEKLLEIKRREDPKGMFKHTFAHGFTKYLS